MKQHVLYAGVPLPRVTLIMLTVHECCSFLWASRHASSVRARNNNEGNSAVVLVCAWLTAGSWAAGIGDLRFLKIALHWCVPSWSYSSYEQPHLIKMNGGILQMATFSCWKIHLFSKSQIHGLAEVGRTSGGHLVQFTPLKQCHPEPVAQDHV